MNTIIPDKIKSKHGKPGQRSIIPWNSSVLTHNWYTEIGHSSGTDPMPFGVYKNSWFHLVRKSAVNLSTSVYLQLDI